MPLRAFIDSDSERILYARCNRAVLMPLRAFIDSDVPKPQGCIWAKIDSLNALTGIH